MVNLVALFEPTQNADGVLDAGLTHVHLLEPTLKGGVLFDVLAVFLQGGCAHEPELTTSQQRLNHVAGVHCGFPGRTRTDDGVELVDKGDDFAVGVLDFVKDGL